MRSSDTPFASFLASFLPLLVLAFALGACSGDDGTEPTSDTGADASDSSSDGGDGDVASCPDDPVPLDGDTCDCEGDRFAGRVGLCDRECLCEFGFWTCTEECDDPEVLRIELGADPQVDEQSGNGDAAINPGETWSVTGTVRALNAGEEGVDTTVRLTSDSLWVEVDGASESLAGLGDEAVEFALEFEVSASAPGGTVNVTLEAYSGFATTSTPIEIEIVPAQIPVLAIEDVRVLDDAGGPTVRIQAGDAIRVAGVVRNTGAVAAQGVALSGSPSSASLSTPSDATLGTIAPGGRSNFELEIDVAADPSELSPVLTLAATADNATTTTREQTVAIYPPDTLAVTGSSWSGTGPSFELVVSVRNTGRFALEALTWSRINYASPPIPDTPPDPPQCTVERPCPDGFVCTDSACVEDPFYESMELGDPTGPGTLAPGATGEVQIPLTVTGATPAIGRVLLRASSRNRSHGPYLIDLVRP